jgi:hypothetical protein
MIKTHLVVIPQHDLVLSGAVMVQIDDLEKIDFVRLG